MGKINRRLRENLAGPGGGPSAQPENLEGLNKNITQHGAGAFPTGGDNPPKQGKTATSGYLDPRFARRGMRKKMKTEHNFLNYVEQRELAEAVYESGFPIDDLVEHLLDYDGPIEEGFADYVQAAKQGFIQGGKTGAKYGAGIGGGIGAIGGAAAGAGVGAIPMTMTGAGMGMGVGGAIGGMLGAAKGVLKRAWNGAPAGTPGAAPAPGTPGNPYSLDGATPAPAAPGAAPKAIPVSPPGAPAAAPGAAGGTPPPGSPPGAAAGVTPGAPGTPPRISFAQVQSSIQMLQGVLKDNPQAQDMLKGLLQMVSKKRPNNAAAFRRPPGK